MQELRRGLFEDKDTVKAQRDALFEKVGALNNHTHELKLAIRDGCGHGGRVRFDRLEGRAQGRLVEGAP